MARPTKTDPSLRRTATAAFAVTPGEASALAARASSAGLSVSAYLREIVLAADAAARATPAAAGGPAATRIKVAAVRELSRVGNNLNQLTRLYHSGRDVPLRAEAVLTRAEAAIMELIAHDAE